mgnify:CR=1 FL=1
MFFSTHMCVSMFVYAVKIKLLGCNIGIGGFCKNLVTFWGPRQPILKIAQKIDQKKCDFSMKKKSGLRGCRGSKKPKTAEIGPRNRHAGLNMHVWLSCCNMPGQKITGFLTAHTGSQHFENNRFCVPMHFKTNRFTFEKFPPPPPLLHPNILISSLCRSGLKS